MNKKEKYHGALVLQLGSASQREIVELGVVGVASVEEASLARGRAVADGDVVVAAVETHHHAVVAGDELAAGVRGVIINVIAGIVSVVQVQRAAAVDPLRAVAAGVVAHQPDLTVRVVDVICTVFVYVVIEPRGRDVDFVGFSAPQVENETSRVIVLARGLPLHPFRRRNQLHFVEIVINWFLGGYFSGTDDKIC